jgi:hypothetical protein
VNYRLRIVEVGAIIAAVMILFGIIVVSNHIKVRHQSFQSMCINNLRLIDSAKKQWALEQGKKGTDIPTMTELWGDMWRGYPEFNEAKLPCCPADPARSFRTSYEIRTVEKPPLCLIDSKNHVLPPY